MDCAQGFAQSRGDAAAIRVSVAFNLHFHRRVKRKRTLAGRSDFQDSPTVRKDLRGGTSVWADSPHIRVRTRASLVHETCDVVIVGAGISGALLAIVLAEAGHDVVIVDRRTPIHGSTLASTAMLQFELDTPLIKLADKIGGAAAKRAYLRSFAAVAALQGLVAKHRLRCGFKARSALYLAGNEMGWRGLRDEARLRQRIGLPSNFLPHAELAQQFGILGTGAILSAGAAELNPAQFSAACFRIAQRHGARIYSPVTITEVAAMPRQVTLHTSNGGSIVAKRAIFATGYEVAPNVPRGDFSITSSWAIATPPQPRAAFWPTRCLIWEAADPYLYVRSTVDNRIIAGGEDSALTSAERRDHAIPHKAEQLLAKLAELLPGRAFTIDYAWAGAFAESPTGLPHISEITGMPNCLSVLACGGNGITFSMVAAEIAKAWCRNRRDPDSDLFR